MSVDRLGVAIAAHAHQRPERPHRALRRQPHLALEAPRRAVAVLLVVEGGRHEDRVLLAGVVAVEPDVVAALAGRPRRAGLGLDLVAHLEAGGGDRRLHVGEEAGSSGRRGRRGGRERRRQQRRGDLALAGRGSRRPGHQQAPEHGDVEEALDPRVEDAHVR